jgi:NAD(P)-dependent dehydrogenase (short-subunit alcohol dehydrogenase family)
MTFTGKVVLLAGGTGGLGRAVSLAFLREGAELIVTYRNDREFADLKGVADANASRLVGRHVDVTDEAAVQQLIAEIGAEGKGLDVLVNTVDGAASALTFTRGPVPFPAAVAAGSGDRTSWLIPSFEAASSRNRLKWSWRTFCTAACHCASNRLSCGCILFHTSAQTCSSGY